MDTEENAPPDPYAVMRNQLQDILVKESQVAFDTLIVSNL